MRSQTVVVTPPQPLITLDEAKRHLRIDDYDNDLEISGFLQAAVAMVDGPDAWLGRSLGLQTLELRMPSFLQRLCGGYGGCSGYGPGFGPEGYGYGQREDFYGDAYLGLQAIKLLCPPVQSVVSVDYLDPTGAPQTLDPSLYLLADRMLAPVSGQTWPATLLQPNAVRIQYIAGYTTPALPATDSVAAVPAGQVPAPIRAAIKLMLGTLYEGRECSAAAGFAGAIGNLLATYRVID